ncbi:MAG: lipid A deacylase LpxR family protein [Flavobacterium sp.]|uniref:lipid A deacylase LpxR family protein n=1 Tax=Flavobacterium sp. TaxID=239 RepID=UPI00120B4A13|nr:lipid A deacylase LpxR family protein [Flavobacterium sp.]RZJ66869.1 MAG: lipid A deacylase LpxR family protein [Flavobacterium sp.]
MKYLLLFLFSAGVFAQSKEIGLVLENDLFTSSVNDKYYTNGVEIFYRYLSKDTSENIVKKIHEFRAGQYIFNPQTVKAADPNIHDRAFAGYLFGQYAESRFYKSESMFRLNGQVGVVGPASGAEQVQKTIHDVFGYKPVRGWEYQIRNTLALQLGAAYSKKIFRGDHFDFHAKGNAVAGTAFAGATVGVLSRVSLKPLLPIYDSTLYGAAVNSDLSARKNQSEFFFYISPSVNYQLYDATIQGSMFNDDSPITFDLIPFRFTGEAGLKYRKNRLDLSYAFIYRGKEADNWVNKGYFFGSIQIGWLLD